MVVSDRISRENGDYLTPFEVSVILRKSVSWVQKRAAEGLIPHRYVGRDLRFVRSEIDGWVAIQPKPLRPTRQRHAAKRRVVR